MANKETVNKVKALLEGHCYGPLREAAEKWLAVADEKYDVKEKAGKAWEKLNDAADKYVDASEKFNEKMAGVSDKVGDAYDKAAEKAAPALDKIGDAAEKLVGDDTEVGKKFDEFKDKIEDSAEKLAENELIKQLKEGINSVGDLLETFSSKEAKDKFGEDVVATMKAHAEALKEKGEKFCDCEACVKAREILKDLGEDIEAKAEELKGEDKPEE